MRAVDVVASIRHIIKLRSESSASRFAHAKLLSSIVSPKRPKDSSATTVASTATRDPAARTSFAIRFAMTGRSRGLLSPRRPSRSVPACRAHSTSPGRQVVGKGTSDFPEESPETCVLGIIHLQHLLLQARDTWTVRLCPRMKQPLGQRSSEKALPNYGPTLWSDQRPRKPRRGLGVARRRPPPTTPPQDPAKKRTSESRVKAEGKLRACRCRNR